MAYKYGVKTRIDLGEFGDDNSGNAFFVEVKNPKMMTYEERTNFIQLGMKLAESADDKESLKVMMSAIILSWNLISITDETPLPIPSQEKESLNKIPGEMFEVIIIKLTKIVKGEDESTKNSSPQSAKSSEEDRLQETSTSADTTK